MKKSFRNKKSGFTLIELLVTITIFVILTGIVLFNSNSFNNSVLLHNFAYDVALTIKQAQSYGVNVSENKLGTFSSSYGIYFNINTDPARGTVGSKNEFVFYNDLDGNITYQNGIVTSCTTSDTECLQKYIMKNGTSIKSMCAGDNENTCQDVTNVLAILFKRPNLNALIYSKGPIFGFSSAKAYAKIVLAAADGRTAAVIVTSTGQIYVKY